MREYWETRLADAERAKAYAEKQLERLGKIAIDNQPELEYN